MGTAVEGAVERTRKQRACIAVHTEETAGSPELTTFKGIFPWFHRRFL